MPKNNGVIIQVGRITETKTALQSLSDYLNHRFGKVVWHIFHPLRGAGEIESFIYHGRKIIRKSTQWKFEYFQYIREFLSTFFFILFRVSHINIYIGMSGFDMFPAVILKIIWRSKIDRLIYYPIDYTRQRFPIRWLNSLYSIFDRWSIHFSDVVIFFNNRSKEIRRLQGASNNKLLRIPNGLFIADIPISPSINRSMNKELYYVGYLDDCHGILETIEMFRQVSSDSKDVKLTIIGSGPNEFTLRKLINRYNLQDRVRLLGHLPHKKVLKILSKGGVGLAPYQTRSGWVYYCDPIKVKEYLACGIPVVISNTVEISKMIKNRKCGLVFNDLNNFVSSVKRITSNELLFHQMAKQAIASRTDFDYNIHYKKLFDRFT